MKQSVFASWVETIGSTATGFLVSLALQYGICWWYGLPLRLQDNLAIIAAFTVASLVRSFAWRRLMEKFHIRRPLSAFMQAVIAERFRQKEVEGYDDAHDTIHEPRDLARAAAAYLIGGRAGKAQWPWLRGYKPAREDDRRDLVRGAALAIAAGELEDKQSREKVAA